jgi:hypothetical protein
LPEVEREQTPEHVGEGGVGDSGVHRSRWRDKRALQSKGRAADCDRIGDALAATKKKAPEAVALRGPFAATPRDDWS